MSKKIVSLLLAMLMLFSMTTVLAEDSTLTVTDMFGREVTLEGPVTRVIATEPADCEILCALGCEDLLVGRGLYCDYPASIQELPAVQSGANTNLEEILALNPQVVIMADMAHTVEQVNQLEENGVKVICIDADSISEVYEAIRLIGTVVGKTTEADALVADMQSTFDEIAAKCEKTDKTVYFEVSPLQWGLWSAGAGTFMQELAEICGMQNAFSDIEGWQAVSEEQVIERNPDYIVLISGMGDTAVDEVMSREGWGDINAIKNAKVLNADSNTLSRPGPRLKDAAVALYNFLYNVEEVPAEEVPAA